MAVIVRMPAPNATTRTVYVAAAGDIGDPLNTGRPNLTGRVVDELIGRHPDVLGADGVTRKGIVVDPLGDLAYPWGASNDFAERYDPYWGSGARTHIPGSDTWQYRNKKPYTDPTVGNHESLNDSQGSRIPKVEPLTEYLPYDDFYGVKGRGMPTGGDYFQGFYPGEGNPGGRYYARELVAPDGKAYWLHIHYNSHVGESGEVDTYTRQLSWFDAMLAVAGATGATLPTARADGSTNNRHQGFAQHVLVSCHHPLMAFTRKRNASGALTGSNGEVAQGPYWVKLQGYTAGLKILMAGHYHNYVRTEPVRWSGPSASPGSAASSISGTLVNGVVLIQNGLGGANLNTLGTSPDAVHADHALKMVDTDYLVSYLMLEPHRATVEGVAVDDVGLGRQTDGPVVLSWSAAPVGTPTFVSSGAQFTPATGAPGTLVTINGTNLTLVEEVRFGSGAAVAGFEILSDTQIRATVPSNAVTGTVRLVHLGTSIPSTQTFTVSAPPPGAPTITDAQPRSGGAGQTVVIDGTGFTGVTGAAGVKFNGVNAASYVVDSNIKITAVTPVGTVGTGPITVTHPTTGTGTSPFSFQGLGAPSSNAALSLDPPRVRLAGVAGGAGGDREYTASIAADASSSTYLVGATFTFEWGDGTTTGPQAGATANHTYSYNHVNVYEKGWGAKRVKLTIVDANGTHVAFASVLLQRDHMLAGLSNGGV